MPAADPGGEVLGYRLRVSDINNGTTWIDFDGQEFGLPLKRAHTIYGLVSGRDY